MRFPKYTQMTYNDCNFNFTDSNVEIIVDDFEEIEVSSQSGSEVESQSGSDVFNELEQSRVSVLPDDFMDNLEPERDDESDIVDNCSELNDPERPCECDDDDCEEIVGGPYSDAIACQKHVANPRAVSCTCEKYFDYAIEANGCVLCHVYDGTIESVEWEDNETRKSNRRSFYRGGQRARNLNLPFPTYEFENRPNDSIDDDDFDVRCEHELLFILFVRGWESQNR